MSRKKTGPEERPGKFMVQWRHVAQMDRFIRAGGYPSAPRLARELELSERTVKRRIAFMRDDLGAPIEYDASRKGYYYSDPDWLLPAIRVSEGDLFALVVAERALRSLSNHPLAAKLRHVFERIAMQLPDGVSIDPSDLAGCVTFAAGGSLVPPPKTFETLARAVREGRTIEIVYYKLSTDEEVMRTVDPYALRCRHGDWYLVGRTHGRDYVPEFHVGRIRKLELTRKTFDRDATGFDVDEYFRHGFGASHSHETWTVTVRLRGWAARYAAERQWHPEQKLKRRKDGSVDVTFPAGWLDEVCAWVLPFGEAAEVIAPAELRETVRDQLERALVRYAGG